jgi:hypothetical protein
MIWFLAYLFHTIGALSFAGSIIIYYKIISSEICFLMMGVYFAAIRE